MNSSAWNTSEDSVKREMAEQIATLEAEQQAAENEPDVLRKQAKQLRTLAGCT
jgi:hypothetical protein